jgi:hypothetical protein
VSGPGNAYRGLAREQRNIDPYLHVEPHFLNVAKCMKVFGQYFKDYYLSRTIKEDTEFAQIFNQHLLVTYTMDACADGEVKTLGEALMDPVPGRLFSTMATVAAAPDRAGAADERLRLTLPFPFAKDLFVTYFNANFLSGTERDRIMDGTTVALVGQIDVVKDAFIQADPLFMGTPSFDHFRNGEIDLALAPYVADWFETLAVDIDEFALAADENGAAEADVAESEWRGALGALGHDGVRTRLAAIVGEVSPPEGVAGAPALFFAQPGLCGTPTPAAFLTTDTDTNPMSIGATLAATPARLLVVQHCGPIAHSLRDTIRAFAVAPHAPRRFCLIDGADTYRILKANGTA